MVADATETAVLRALCAQTLGGRRGAGRKHADEWGNTYYLSSAYIVLMWALGRHWGQSVLAKMALGAPLLSVGLESARSASRAFPVLALGADFWEGRNKQRVITP